MAPKHKTSSSSKGESSVSKEPPRKKAKSNGGGQSSLGSFIKTPLKNSNKSNGGVISLLSDSEPGDGDELEHVRPALTSKSRQPPAIQSEVIDLDGMLSSDSDGEDIKPVAGPSGSSNGSNAALHPLFRKVAIKSESEVTRHTDPDRDDEDNKEDVKSIIADRKGKGKTNGTSNTSESPKKLIFPKIETDEPVTYPLEKDIFEFDPKNDISTDTWPRTQAGKVHVPYSFLVAAFVLISATRSRLIIVTVLTNTLRTIVEYDPDVLKDTVYLVGPFYRILYVLF
jgi:hypothetical protein